MAEESVELTKTDPVTGEALDVSGYRSDLEASEPPPETEMIKARIEETRREMGETIDAIQERLSFANISEQVSETVSSAIESAKDTAYDATIGKAVNVMKNFGDGVSKSNTFRAVRSNPFPLAFIGIGAGLLAYQAFSQRGSRVRTKPEPMQLEGQTENHEKSPGRVARAYKGISDRAGNAYGSVSDKANATYESVSDALSNAYNGAGDAAHRAYDRIGEYGTKAYDRAGEYGTIAQDKYDEYIEENPLAVGAVALALGAAVGFAIPSTRYEGKLMGNARDNVMKKVNDAAGTLVEKSKHAAMEAGRTIQDESRSLGH